MKDDIENIYSDLKTFSKEPPKALWGNIEAKLHPKKKKRRGLWFWGAAAAVIVFFSYILLVSKEGNHIPIEEVVDIEQQSIDGEMINESDDHGNSVVEQVIEDNVGEDDSQEEKNNEIKRPNDIVNQKQSPTRSQKIIKNSNQGKLTDRADKKNIINNKNKLNRNYAHNTDKDADGKLSDKENLLFQNKKERLLAYEKNKLIEKIDSIPEVKEKSLLDISEELMAHKDSSLDTTNSYTLNTSKWSIEVLGGVSNTSSESYIKDVTVNTSSLNDFVYGLKVGYSISERLVVKSGIGKNVLGQEIDNINYIVQGATLSVGNSQGLQDLIDGENVLFIGSPEAVNDISTYEGSINNGVLEQQFGYIQIPLEFSYKVLSKKKYNVAFGVGGNVNFITKNVAFLDNERIGENLDVETTIFGATLNSNVSYLLSKHIVLFIEPSYNYFQKPIDNNNQAFNNTQLRALIGLQYKF